MVTYDTFTITEVQDISITSTSVTYQKGTSGTVKPTGTWLDTIPSIGEGEYLWTKTVVTYSDSSETESYSVSRNAINGINGNDGNSPTVTSTVTEYVQSDSGTSTPTSGWNTTPPTAIAGKYIWTKITVTYSDGATAISYSVAKNGTDGKDGGKWYSGTKITGTSTTATIFSGSGISSAVIGDMYLNTTTYNTYQCTVGGSASVAKWVYVNNIKGGVGDTGRGISSIQNQYYLSTSNTEQTGGSWSTTMPSYTTNHYYWTRSHIIWDDGSSPTDTTPILDNALTDANANAIDARKVATNYLAVDNTGIMVADMQNGEQTPSTATGKNVFIDNDSVDIRNGTNILAQFAADQINLRTSNGSANVQNITIKPTGMKIQDSRCIFNVGSEYANQRPSLSFSDDLKYNRNYSTALGQGNGTTYPNQVVVGRYAKYASPILWSGSASFDKPTVTIDISSLLSVFDYDEICVYDAMPGTYDGYRPTTAQVTRDGNNVIVDFSQTSSGYWSKNVDIFIYGNPDKAFVVGNGTSDSSRSNAFTIGWNGDVKTNGGVNANSLSSNNNIDVNGNANVGGDLSVTGDVSITGNIDSVTNINATGNSTIGGTSTITGKLTANGGVDVVGDIGVTGDVDVINGSVSTTGDLDVGGDAAITGNTTITGNTGITGNLDVVGTITGNSLPLLKTEAFYWNTTINANSAFTSYGFDVTQSGYTALGVVTFGVYDQSTGGRNSGWCVVPKCILWGGNTQTLDLYVWNQHPSQSAVVTVIVKVLYALPSII